MKIQNVSQFDACHAINLPRSDIQNRPEAYKSSSTGMVVTLEVLSLRSQMKETYSEQSEVPVREGQSVILRLNAQGSSMESDNDHSIN